MSLIFRAYANHPRPHLVGMALAIAAAGALHCQLRWPNDLTIQKRKLGGILTELIQGVPVVGIGVNLNQTSFPAEFDESATSLAREEGGRYEAEAMARAILHRLGSMPEPNAWSDLAPLWNLFDDTAGKRYQLVTGETARPWQSGAKGSFFVRSRVRLLP